MATRLWITVYLLVSGPALLAQEEQVEVVEASKGKAKDLKEITVIGSRHESTAFEVPYSVDVVDRDEILHKRQPRSIPDALEEIPGVLRQKTGQGQSSPFIRGFTGFRNLLLIDGIRLNNSVFRDGPNQYWSTIDPLMVERIEVLKGSAATLYGSDAIGGVVNVDTIRPKCYTDDGFGVGARNYFQYRSAEHAVMDRVEASTSWGGTAGIIVGGSWRDFGEVDGGRHVGRQPNTDYLERAVDAKLEFFPAENLRVVAAHQDFNQDDAWRVHKTTSGISWHGTTVGNEQKRILDQDRELTYVQAHWTEIGEFIQSARLSFSWHTQAETRYRVKSSGSGEHQGFTVGTAGLWMQLESETDYGRFTYGAEWYHDNVRSFSDSFNSSGVYTGSEIQGPVADDAEYDLVAAFLQDEISLAEDWDLILGVRFTYAAADANKYKDPVTGLQASLDDDWTNVSGNARLVYHLDEGINVFAGASQGFRAPNLSDLTRLDTARTNEIETAAPDLDPENFITFELGAKALFEDWEAQAVLYYTLVDDMIIRRPTGVVIGTDMEVTKANAGDGYVMGLELAARYYITEDLSVFGSFVVMRSSVDQYPTSAPVVESEPLSREMPVTFIGGVRWKPEAKDCWVEGLVAAVDDANRLSTSDEQDTQRIPPDGTPGYTVFTLRGGVRVHENVACSLSIENVTNKDYRIHGSGVNEPGTSVILSLDASY